MDLQRGKRLTLAVQDDIDPQFRFATPEGDMAVAVTFPDSLEARREIFQKLKQLAALKQVIAYTMTFGISEPNALLTVGVSADGVVGCLVRVSGECGAFTEASFGEPAWVPRDSIDEEFAGLLPGRVSALTDADIGELEAWFGVDGRFPLVHLESGKLGL